MRLVELFDNPITNVEWEEHIFGDEARFNIGKYTYNVGFTPMPPEDFIQQADQDGEKLPDELRAMLENDVLLVDVAFEIVGVGRPATFDITGTGNEIKVFSTVVSLIKKYLSMPSNSDIQLIHISSKEPSRTKLYRRMVSSFAKGKTVWEVQGAYGVYWVVKL